MPGPLLAPLFALAALSGGRNVEVGDTPKYAFQSAPRNGVLVKSVEDLRGRPALFEFWGTRCPSCVQAGVPAALKLQETWGDDLQVVLVEAQGAPADAAAGFALAQRWFGGRALWTSEVPFWPGGNSLPAFVLLGNQGQVLLKGNPLAQAREIERLVAEQVRLRRSVPAGVCEVARPAWAEYAKGNLGRAVQLARSAEGQVAGDPAELERLRGAVETLQRGIERRFAEVAALIEAGWTEEADERLDDLAARCKGDPGLERRAADLAERLDGEALQAEREAARSLARLLSRFFESGGDPAAALELERFAERQPGTKAAARALDWARIAPVRR
jgi:thiol-disulfide isomerase/thioredoxin